RPLIVGLVVGAFAVAADYLAHALFAIPLLPEQAGYLLLKFLPLPLFENLLKAFGVLARPLLLLGATLVAVAAYGIAGALLDRLFPGRYLLDLTAEVAVVRGNVAYIACTPMTCLIMCGV